MRRPAIAAVLSGIVALALPVPSASACMRPGPSFGVSPARVPRGGTLRVAGGFTTFATPCQPPVPTTPPPSAPAPSSATASPGEEVGATATSTFRPGTDPSATPPAEPAGTTTPPPTPVPLAPAAAAPPRVLHQPSVPVRIVIGTRKGEGGNELAGRTWALGTAPYTAVREKDGDTRYRFATTVRVPADLPPGTYLVAARAPGEMDFGVAAVTVLTTLPDTGRDVAPLARLAALLLVTGVGALTLDQARAARVRAHS